MSIRQSKRRSHHGWRTNAHRSSRYGCHLEAGKCDGEGNLTDDATATWSKALVEALVELAIRLKKQRPAKTGHLGRNPNEEETMPSFMYSYTAQTYALMRIVAGFLFLWHGTQKLFGFPGTPHPVPPFVAYVAGPIELIGGTLVMIGRSPGGRRFSVAV